MKRIHIEFTKTYGEPFEVKVLYVIPTITIAWYKNFRETAYIYFELTWILWIFRVQIDVR